MGLPDSLVLQEGATQILFADHATDFGADSATAKYSLLQGAQTDVQMDLTGLAVGAGWESAQVDLTASRDPSYSVMASIEWATEPVTGSVVEFYWAPSSNATATDGNPGNIDGASAIAPSGPGTLAELKAQCIFIGNFIATADATTDVQTAFVGIFVPPQRYGILLVVNETADIFHSVMDETHIVFNPIVEKIID